MSSSYRDRLMELIDYLREPEFDSLLMLAVILLGAVRACSRISSAARWCGYATFLIWILAAAVTGGLQNTAHLMTTAVRAGLLGMIVTALLTILFGLWASLRRGIDVVFGRPFRKQQDKRQLRNQRKREAKERSRRESEQRIADAVASQNQALQAEQASRRRKVSDTDRQTRASRRFELQLLYERHRAGLAESFPEDRFKSAVETGLTDDTPIDEFLRRAELLEELLLQRVGPAAVVKQPDLASVEDVVAYYAERKSTVDALDLDEDVRDTILASLNEAQDRQLQELLR